jgi:hypothetical protein
VEAVCWGFFFQRFSLSGNKMDIVLSQNRAASRPQTSKSEFWKSFQLTSGQPRDNLKSKVK